MLSHNENTVAKVDEVESMIRYQMKKVLCLALAVGHMKMTDNESVSNLNLAVEFLMSSFEKPWQIIWAFYIESTMGKPQCLH